MIGDKERVVGWQEKLNSLLMLYAIAFINYDKTKNREIIAEAKIKFAKEEVIKALTDVQNFIDTLMMSNRKANTEFILNYFKEKGLISDENIQEFHRSLQRSGERAEAQRSSVSDSDSAGQGGSKQ